MRAPFKEPVLYTDQNFVFKARALNISEGGMLLDQVPHFPEEGGRASVMLSLPQYPHFKNFSLAKLLSFNREMFSKKTVRAVCEVVRKSGNLSEVDQVFSSRVGAKFCHIEPKAQKDIKDYVETFAGNLIYLQVLIDNIQTDEEGLAKTRALSRILHYDPDIKISQLRQEAARDYASLQWL